MSNEHIRKKPKVNQTNHDLGFFGPWTYPSFFYDDTQALAQSHKEYQKFKDSLSTHQKHVDALNGFGVPAKKQSGLYADNEGQLESIAGFSKGSFKEPEILPVQGSFAQALKDYEALCAPLSSEKRKLYALGSFENPWKTESKYLDEHMRTLEFFGAPSMRQPIHGVPSPRSQSLVESQGAKSQRPVSIRRAQVGTSGQSSLKAAESKAPELVVLKPSTTPNPGIETNQLLRKLIQTVEITNKISERMVEKFEVIEKKLSETSAVLNAGHQEIKDLINPIHQNLATIADLAVTVRIACGGSAFPEFQELSPDEQDYLDDSEH